MRSSGPARRLGLRRAGDALLVGLVVLVLLVAGSVAGVLPVQLMRVTTDSMSPQIEAGNLLVVQHWGSPEVRDVVAFPDPSGGEMLVKRVVGLGGDSVGIEDGVLVVNGAPVCEPDIDQRLSDGVYFGPVTVPPGEIFVMGDNRSGSIDSREFGPVHEDDVVGIAVARVWPSPGPLTAERC